METLFYCLLSTVVGLVIGYIAGYFVGYDWVDRG